MAVSTRKGTSKGTSKGNGTSKGSKPPAMNAVRGQFNGKPTLSLVEPGSDFPVLTFGLRKAKAIVACLDAIKVFAAE